MATWIAGTGCALCAVAALLPIGRAVFTAAVVIGTIIWLGAAWQGGLDAVQPLAAACVFLIVVLLRRLLQDRRRMVVLLAAERAAHTARVDAAAAEERSRIARDLHDGLTHLLTGQLLILRTAAAALTDRDIASAAERIDHAVTLSRQTLVEARDVVEVLRGRVPDLALVRATVADWEDAARRDVRLQLPDHTPALTGAAWSAVLATLREALTNVTRHSAGDDVRVTLNADQTGVELLVADGGSSEKGYGDLPRGAGAGLQGLRERAALAGGGLSAGPDHAGWQVRLTLPLAALPVVEAPSR